MRKRAQKQDIIWNGRIFYTHSYIPQAIIYNVYNTVWNVGMG